MVLVTGPTGHGKSTTLAAMLEDINRNRFDHIITIEDPIEYIFEGKKAHPDVFNVLLQVLDDGRLTDSKGRTVNFKNTIIILTSNIGSKKMAQMMEENKSQDEIQKEMMNELK